jgi:hypothetical protein
VNWCQGEPNNYNGSEDMAMMGKPTGETCWNDVGAGSGLFIIEKTPAGSQ